MGIQSGGSDLIWRVFASEETGTATARSFAAAGRAQDDEAEVGPPPDLIRLYFGRRRSASQPGPILRFARVSDPPCASAICRLRAKTDSRAARLGREKWNEQIRRIHDARPVSRTNTSTHIAPDRASRSSPFPPVSSEASAALCRMLISNCSNCAASRSIVSVRPGRPDRPPCASPGSPPA